MALSRWRVLATVFLPRVPYEGSVVGWVVRSEAGYPAPVDHSFTDHGAAQRYADDLNHAEQLRVIHG